MRKATTPPKRKPVLAGRRAAKRKPATGSRAKAGKAETVAKVAKAGAPAKAAGKPAPKTISKIVSKTVSEIVSKTVSKPASKVVVKVSEAARTPAKAPARETAKAPAGNSVAKAAAVAQRPNHEVKDSKKASQAERHADKASGGLAVGAGRFEGGAAVTSDKPGEAAAPASLPTPIASFTI